MNNSEKVQNQTNVNKVFPNGIDKEQIELTEGEHVINVSFQPSGRNDVWDLKRRLAELYDWLVKKCSETSEDLERYNRKQRCMRIALTELEKFQMNAVKALTYTKEFVGDERYVRPMHSPTEGQLAMTVSFNAATGDLAESINFIKNTCANLYDEIETEITYRDQDFVKKEKEFYRQFAEDLRKKFESLSEEQRVLESAKIKNTTGPAWPEELQLENRKFQHARGAADEALFCLRQFQMFAVKAITR